MENLFIYGNLKKPEIQKKVFGRAAESSEDSLKGYKISQININGEIFPILINSKKPYDFALGFVLEVSEEEFKKIDEYGGEEYKRIQVVLSSGKEAWVHVKA